MDVIDLTQCGKETDDHCCGGRKTTNREAALDHTGKADVQRMLLPSIFVAPRRWSAQSPSLYSGTEFTWNCARFGKFSDCSSMIPFRFGRLMVELFVNFRAFHEVDDPFSALETEPGTGGRLPIRSIAGFILMVVVS